MFVFLLFLLPSNLLVYFVFGRSSPAFAASQTFVFILWSGRETPLPNTKYLIPF